jgi:hypothetical protein
MDREPWKPKPLMFDGKPLDKPCECGGVRAYYEGVCGSCMGTGMEMTELGEQLYAFIIRHMKETDVLR